MNPTGDHLIVIPVFNEAATIGDIVERARLHGSVLVVDDGSTDRVPRSSRSADAAARARRCGAPSPMRSSAVPSGW